MQKLNEITKHQTNYLKFIAILLITNSHLDQYYPYPQLGTGGSLGNTIFFLFSGYGLAKGLKKPDIKWKDWLTKRLLRIYPAVTIVTLSTIFIFNFIPLETTIAGLCKQFLWPTQFWFISAIIIFYFLYYPLFKFGGEKLILILLVALLTIYIYFYINTVDLNSYTIEGSNYFKWLYYFMVMLIGSLTAGSTLSIAPDGLIKNIALCFLSTVAYFGFLVLLSKKIFLDFQFFAHILNLWVVYHLIGLTVCIKNLNMKINRSIEFIANLTLEIYLLQYAIYSIDAIKSLIFPLNLIVFSCSIIAVAYLVSLISNLIIRKLTKDSNV